MIYALIVAFILIHGSTLLFMYFYNQQIQKEREALYDRIQSNNLYEYKTLVEPIKPREKKEDTPKYDFVG